MEDEVHQLAGERCQRRQGEQGYRWGREGGYLVVDGQKAKIERPRVRSMDGREQKPGSYQLFRRNQPLDEAALGPTAAGPCRPATMPKPCGSSPRRKTSPIRSSAPRPACELTREREIDRPD